MQIINKNYNHEVIYLLSLILIFQYIGFQGFYKRIFGADLNS